MGERTRRVLILGGGIGGVQAGLDLANMGVPVTLVEEKPSIGGRMAQLDKTFPTNDCSTCILSPKLVELSSHPRVSINTFSTLEKLARQDDHFSARIRKWARFVDAEKCTACGLCAQKCPVKVPDEFNRGLSDLKCIGIPYPQAVPPLYRIDKRFCLYLTKGSCGACKKVCPAGAVDFEQQDSVEIVQCNSVILATGAEEYMPRTRPEYGYQVYRNVVTSIEYERLLSASGPTKGSVARPSDAKEPQKIAFIQCVGSRDSAVSGHAYCSSFCCMQATKDAIVTREHSPEAKSTIFYIDIRAYGKDFDRFVERARTSYGVRYVRSRISELIEAPGTKNIVVRYATPEGRVEEEEFDLAVLSVGVEMPRRLQAMLESLGVAMGDNGFPRSSPFRPCETNVEGIYLCGTAMGPADIPETVISASAAAVRAARGLVGLQALSGVEQEEPERCGGDGKEVKKFGGEFDIEGRSPRIGVVVCRCGVNIGSVVDVPSVVRYAKALPNVRFGLELMYACSHDSVKSIANALREHEANRLVVASCSPRTHEALFQGCLERAGLNRHLLHMANIRDQCSWVHRDCPELATKKAIDLVRMAVGKARHLTPLYERDSCVNHACLVIGGGIAGMTAARAVADHGFQVYLVEKDRELGGNLRRICSLVTGEEVGPELQETIKKVKEHPNIEVFLDACVEDVSGYVGNFSAKLLSGGAERTVEHGAVIVATGAREHLTDQYGYRTDPYVVTQREFERIIENRNRLLRYVKAVAMIQCVDSREGSRNYCSRACCGHAVKNIIRFKQRYPDKHVYVFSRDVRTYGLLEPFYTKAREAGALFLRYTEERKPAVEKIENGRFLIRIFDEIVGREVELPVELIVLGVGMDPSETHGEMARMLKVPLNEDGFFHEAHVKLRPVDFAVDGVYVCGTAHGPKYAHESVIQALAAAGRAMTILTREKVRSIAHTAVVRESRCSGCGLCAEVCAYGAIDIDGEKKVARVNELLCKGCGSCAATCLGCAIDLRGFTDKQLVKEFQELFAR